MAPKKLANVPMPASVKEKFSRLSCCTGLYPSPLKSYAWYSTANPQHCAL